MHVEFDLPADIPGCPVCSGRSYVVHVHIEHDGAHANAVSCLHCGAGILDVPAPAPGAVSPV